MKKVFHVISNTHWDREWRFPFQRNRQMLVDMIDKTIEILESNNEYRAFHLDSQSIVIKDYLEIKPDNKQRISKLVNDKRLLIGPWYILPEEFQVGGENLIRNLLIGHRICKSIGRVSKIGYSPFSWGQISQLPQIYSEFGINLIMFYRGINSLESPNAEFIWEGADGTRMISSRFSTMPRYNFYFYIYRPVIHNEGFNDVEYNWNRGGTPFHFADSQMSDEDYFIINPVDEYFQENISPQVNLIIKNQANDFTSPHVIWMEGHDSSGPNEKTVKIIKDIRKIFPEMDVRHSTLEEYAESLYNDVDKNKLILVTGERRSSQFDNRSGNLYGYTTSARMYLKQKNFEAEKWIQFYAEPFNSFAHLLGKNINEKYLQIAWELIVQNSAHDSIGGCSLDEIHEDMMHRYKQSIEISKGVFERAIKYIIKNIKTTSFVTANPNNDIFLTVFNPNSTIRTNILKVNIDIPRKLDEGSIKLIDSNKKEIKIHIQKRNAVQPVLEQMIDRPMYFDMIRYEIFSEVLDIPSFGYKTFKVLPFSNKAKSPKKLCSKQNGKFVLENEFIKIVINDNGTFNFTNKKINYVQNNLGYFYDEGEAGHAWVNKPIKPFITTIKSKPKIRNTVNNELYAEVVITNSIKVPADLKERKRRKKSLIIVPILMKLSINKHSKFIDIKISVDNNAESHRLRIMFPTFSDAIDSFGEGQFDVVKRAVERIDSSGWVEQPMYDYPMHNFIDVTNYKFGAAVFVEGLKEYEVINDKDKTLAITLFRAFEYIITPSSKQDYTFQKGSQCFGKNEYHLAYYLHEGNWENGGVFSEAMNFNCDLRAVEHGASNGSLPLEFSFLEIENSNIVFSCFKQSEDEEPNSLVLRVYNPTTSQQSSLIKFYKNIKSVEEVTLEETLKQRINLSAENSFFTVLDKKKIKTFKIFF